MNILIFNCGSSSQGFKVYQAVGVNTPEVVAAGKARNVATRTQADSVIDWAIRGQKGSTRVDLPSHRLAAQEIIQLLKLHSVEVDAIGHRFVHGGSQIQHTFKIDDAVLPVLRDCFPLAPIHNPNSYSVIEVCLQLLPDAAQFAVVDTAFHAALSAEASEYAIPRGLARENGFRKYGFHGISFQYVSVKAAAYLGRPLEEIKLILCHLGTGGSSMAAVKNGHSIDTTMGYSPLPGLVMSTRCGDIDPEIILEMMRRGNSVDKVENILNNQSGLIGLSGFSSNLEEIIAESEKGNPDCQIAFDVYAHRMRIYLGAYTWLLNSADAIVFTDDVGVKSWKLREKVCGGVENLNIVLDTESNRLARPDEITCISSSASRTRILVIPTDEEQVILDEVLGQMTSTITNSIPQESVSH